MNNVLHFLLCILLASIGASCSEAPADREDAIALSRVLGTADVEGFAVADKTRTFDFPADHGAHPEYRSEWWYLTVVLSGDKGDEYGVQFTLFRQALRPLAADASDNPWRSGQVYLGHLAVTSVRDGSHAFDQRFVRGHPQLAQVRATPFRLTIDDWSITETAESWHLVGQGESFAIDLHLDPDTAIVLQGDGGLSRKGEGSASYYYSMPRMHSTGRLCFGDDCRSVTGLGWFDREWSTSLLGDHLDGWDWFALQLDDGRSIMAFRLRRKDGTRDPFDHGMEVTSRQHRILTPSDYRLEPHAWFEDDTGRRWPVGWYLHMDDGVFSIRALVEDQVMDMGFKYWEGIVAIDDLDGKRLGRGYMELTGY